jgi:hypothetical protein
MIKFFSILSFIIWVFSQPLTAADRSDVFEVVGWLTVVERTCQSTTPRFGLSVKAYQAYQLALVAALKVEKDSKSVLSGGLDAMQIRDKRPKEFCVFAQGVIESEIIPTLDLFINNQILAD